jgi:hypothetical protein
VRLGNVTKDLASQCILKWLWDLFLLLCPEAQW